MAGTAGSLNVSIASYNSINITAKMFGDTVCVSKCPNDTYELSKCAPNIDFPTCPRAEIGSDLYLSRYCLPRNPYMKEELLKKIASGDLGRYMSDLATCWWVFLVLGGITFVLSFTYLVLMRWFAKPIIYLSMVSIVVLLVGGGFYVYFIATKYEMGDNTRKAMQGMGILLWILSGIYLIILCCCWSRIKLGCAIMEASSDYVANTPSVLFVPLIFFVICGAWVVWWVISAIYVYSVGEAQ